jgi:large subunit ribosomal protein L16
MMPKRTKYRKEHRGRLHGFATRGNRVSFGDFGLMSLDAGWITGRQIEAGRVAANRATDGEVSYWAAVVKPGTVLFELGGVTEDKAKVAFKRVAHKLPIKVKMIRRSPTT